MPQLDFDGANSKISADKIQGQSGTTVTIPAGHNLAGDGSGLTSLSAANITSGGTLPALNGSALTSLPAHTGNVAFPATQVASADANTLDDYEEGTWTYVVKAGTTAQTLDGGYSTGKYTKIGRLVHISGYAIISATSGSGYVTIEGLPFANANATGNVGAFGISAQYVTYSGQMTIIVGQGSSTLYVYQFAENGTPNPIHSNNLANGSRWMFSGCYSV
jgi:hypothetical protein